MSIEVKNSSRGKYAEAFKLGLVMSLGQKVGTKIEMLFPTTTCKDFLNDVIWSEKTGNCANIYGFSWKKRGILEKPLYIILKDDVNMTEAHAKNLEKNLKFFSKLFGKKQTKVYYHDSHLYCKIDPAWYDAPYLFALYTLFMSTYNKSFNTLEEYYEEMKKDPVRKDYFLPGKGYEFPKVIDFILNKKVFKYRSYEDCASVSTTHNDSGLVNIKNCNNL